VVPAEHHPAIALAMTAAHRAARPSDAQQKGRTLAASGLSSISALPALGQG
jgi:hypothetical protein